MNLNFRGIDAKIAAKIHSYRVEHGLNLNQSLEAIVEEWAKMRKEFEGTNLKGDPELPL